MPDFFTRDNSYPSGISAISHDSGQLRRIKAITCSLWDTWSQPTTSLQTAYARSGGRIERIKEGDIHPLPHARAQNCLGLVNVAVIDRVSHALWHHGLFLLSWSPRVLELTASRWGKDRSRRLNLSLVDPSSLFILSFFREITADSFSPLCLVRNRSRIFWCWHLL